MKVACGLPRAPVFIGAADALHPGVHLDWTHVVAKVLDRCPAHVLDPWCLVVPSREG